LAIAIRENTDVAEARRNALALSRTLAFDENSAGRLAIVVTEAATNAIKHGGGGAILLSQYQGQAGGAVEMFAIDRGPGMDDIERSRQDGFSTAGSKGNGLGAIARLSDAHEIYSARGLGTVVMARVCYGELPPGIHAVGGFDIGAVSVPRTGEEVSGDGWIAHPRHGGLRLIVADGLGHGPAAAAASSAALAIADRYDSDSAESILNRVHDALRSTRGAAVSAAVIDTSAEVVYYAGLGNVSGSLSRRGESRRQMVSHNGTAGHSARKVQHFTYPWRSGALMILHSDGLATHWSLEKYPGIYDRHPGVIAALLFRDFQRGRDDATVVVVRQAAVNSEVWP
jgi:anti-sigma regulatory factor (Ser/Thr protein kinase)